MTRRRPGGRLPASRRPAARKPSPAVSRRPSAEPLPIPPEIVPDPELGQNFLTNPEVLRREIGYANLTATDRVLEIGPGIGHLTALLCAEAATVAAIELDRRFAPILQPVQDACPGLEILWGDALTLAWPPCDKLVANLPYRQALPLIFRLLQPVDDRPRIHTAILVIQERLARRLAARPAGPGYGRVSVLVQRLAGVRLLETVRAREFQPPPTVDSAMLRLRPCRPRFPVADEAAFARFLDFVFLRRDRPLADGLAALAAPASPSPGAPRAWSRTVEARIAPELLETPPAHLDGPELARVAAALAETGLSIPEIPDDMKRKAQKYFS